jgi:hypothetical protein
MCKNNPALWDGNAGRDSFWKKERIEQKGTKETKQQRVA